MAEPTPAFTAELDGWLARWAASARPTGGYRWSHQHDGGVHDRHLVVSALVHGNEVGPMPGLVAVLEALVNGRLKYGGRLTLLLGNPEAAAQDVRFLESDLNRVFVETPPDTHEGRRATALKPLLAAADLHLDFHQTILDTRHGFYICPWYPVAEQWARVLHAAPVWVTRPPGESFSSGTMCCDEYTRSQGKTALTLEFSRAGFDVATADAAADTVRRTMATLDAIAAGETDLDRAAAQAPELRLLETIHAEPFASAQLALRPGLVNFVDVRAGDALGADGAPALRCPADGQILFPKYPQRDAHGRAHGPHPNELYRVVRDLPQHPRQLWVAGPDT